MKFIRTPFANNGDKDPVPQTDPSGNVNWDLGYPISYSKDPAVDPTAKRIEREMFNEIFNFLSAGLRELQVTGVAPFIPAADNGGVAYPYGLGAIVNYQDVPYISLKINNTSLPTVVADWSPIPTTAFVQDMIGNYSDTGLLTTSQTLTPAQAGMVFGIGTAGISITVPDLTAVPNGAAYTFKNLANGIVTILPPADGAFYVSDKTVASLVLGSGDSVTVVGAATVYGALISKVAGNFQAHRLAEFNTTLAPSNMGESIQVGNANVVLPPAASVPPGSSVKLLVTGSGTLSVLGGVSFVVGGLNGNVVTSWQMVEGDEAVCVNDGGRWLVFGTMSLKQSSKFASALTASGYQKLPSGLIIQWGQMSISYSSPQEYTGTITFPISFPTALKSVVGTSNDTLNTAKVVMALTSPSTTAWKVRFETPMSGGGNNFTWIAIGY